MSKARTRATTKEFFTMGFFDFLFGGNKKALPDFFTNGVNEETITLNFANGESVEFYTLAAIPYKGKYYAVLTDVEVEDAEEDDIYVFEVTAGRDGDSFNIEQNQRIVDGVMEAFQELLNEQ
jgi:uncharacterized protein YrzB (UPF0473 family)